MHYILLIVIYILMYKLMGPTVAMWCLFGFVVSLYSKSLRKKRLKERNKKKLSENEQKKDRERAYKGNRKDFVDAQFEVLDKEENQKNKTEKDRERKVDDYTTKLDYCVQLSRQEHLPALNTIEIVINELRNIIPILKYKYPQNEITWQTEKIASVYLPELINSYMELNNAQRYNRKQDFIVSMELLEEEILGVRSNLNSANEKEFEIKTNQIKLRFSKIIK